MKRKKVDKIRIEISCTSETIANALNISREDIREIDDDEN